MGWLRVSKRCDYKHKYKITIYKMKHICMVQEALGILVEDIWQIFCSNGPLTVLYATQRYMVVSFKDVNEMPSNA